MEGANLGDPLDYGAYLIGQLTGSWQTPTGVLRHDDWQHPLPDFNLDSDRGYAYQCWDYTAARVERAAGAPHLPDSTWRGRTSGGARPRS